MRVVLVTTALTKGGAWRHVEDLATGVADRGHDVVVGLRPDARELRQAARVAGLRSAPWRRTLWWRDAVWHGHLHDTFDPRFLAAAAVRRGVGPTVLTEHLPRTNASDERLLPGGRRPGARLAKTTLKRTQFHLADAVIAVSRSSAAFIVQRYGVAPERIAVVPNGIAVHRQHASGRSREPRAPMAVLCAGSLNSQKGQDLLIRAAALARERWDVVLAGAGAAEGRLRRQAAELGGRVTFAGWRDDVLRLIDDADVVCVPSRWESFGYVALEAMAARRPVVGADVDGVRELIEDGVTGVLVPPEDPAALASALDRLARDPALREALGAAGRSRAERRFSLDLMVGRTLEVYRRVRVRGDARGRPEDRVGDA